MLLILDVACYKYPFHWLPRMAVWDAMNQIDKETGETRGFMMVRKSDAVTVSGKLMGQHMAMCSGKGMERRRLSTQYTKPLNPPAIAFSTKGVVMFCEAIAEGTAFGSLKLIENFGMQTNLNFYGPASLCTVLNALRVDPNRAWKDPWCWYEDHMVGNSEIMKNVQKKGISFDSLAELAREHVNIEAFKAQHSSLEQFTNCMMQTTSTEQLYMILSYSRKTVNQTGDGHFSPMAAYHKGRDMLLILDVARYK